MISPAKHLSRKPFMLMLRDDSGELSPLKLDSSLANSDNAIIVLDEYRDTTWVWIGRNVSMPTRMHALRMGKSVQKSGYKIGVTTIGLAAEHLVEMLEKDDSDPQVASNIAAFREAIAAQWRFEDKVLAFDPKLYDVKPAEPIPGSPEATGYRPSGAPEPEPVSAPEPEPVFTEPEKPAVVTPTAVPSVGASIIGVEEKTAFLLYSTVKHADLVYTERIEKDGNRGFKIEAPGTLVIEVLMDGNNLKIDPPEFGDTEGAQAIKAEYETWLNK
jgi:hypothetical protein